LDKKNVNCVLYRLIKKKKTITIFVSNRDHNSLTNSEQTTKQNSLIY